jgi:hypothetical protein
MHFFHLSLILHFIQEKLIKQLISIDKHARLEMGGVKPSDLTCIAG